MRKWKHDYLSQKSYLSKDEAGITLVELLAAISILSVVILLAGSLHIFGQRHFITQTQSAEQANDLSYALTVLSKDLRKQEATSVEIEENEIYINGERIFYVENNQLLEKNKVIVEPVESMSVTRLSENEVRVILRTSAKNVQDKNYETTIYFRR